MQMITTYFYPAAKKTEPVVIDGRRNQVVENFVDIADNPLFDKANVEQIRFVKKAFTANQLPPEHPAHKKVNEALAKTPLANLRKTDRIRKHTLVNTKENTATVFVQNNLTLDQVKAAIQAQGSTWQELVLNNVDDETLSLMAKNCPQLTSLKLVLSGRQNSRIFSGLGLQCIAQLPQLQTLDLDFWCEAMGVSAADFLQLLNQTSLQKSLTNLSLSSTMLTDEHLSAVAKYPNLSTFNVTASFITSVGVNALFQSSTLKNTLQSLNILGSYPLFTTVGLAALSTFPKLTEVTLNGKWEATDANVLSFLKAKPALTVLGISGYPISQDVLEQAATMSSLVNLALGDCSKVTNFANLVQNQTQLNVLLLDQALKFSDSDMGYLAKWESLSSLTLLGVNDLYSGFLFFCSSPKMAKTLKTFHFSGTEAVCSSKALGSLGNFGALTTLRLENLSYFNDESLQVMTNNTPLCSSLEGLELNGVSIDNDSMKRLAAFTKLNTFMLANCRALTEKGMRLFMHNLTLQSQLQLIYLDGVSLNNEMIRDFNLFKNIQTLYLGNLVSPSATSKALNNIWNLPTIMKNNTNATLIDGEGLVPYADFLKGQGF